MRPTSSDWKIRVESSTQWIGRLRVRLSSSATLVIVAAHAAMLTATDVSRNDSRRTDDDELLRDCTPSPCTPCTPPLAPSRPTARARVLTQRRRRHRDDAVPPATCQQCVLSPRRGENHVRTRLRLRTPNSDSRLGCRALRESRLSPSPLT